jgi:hypothetical protein
LELNKIKSLNISAEYEIYQTKNKIFKIKNDEIIKILKAIQEDSLEELTISNHKFPIIDIFENLKCQKLKTLIAENNNSKEDKLFDFFEHDYMNSIEKIDLRNLNIINKDITSGKKFNFKIKSLKSLNIINSRMNYANIIKFLDSVHESNDKLEELHINNSFANEKDDSNKREFLKKLNLFKELKYLNIYYSRSVFDYKSKNFYDDIIQFKKIKFLNVSECDIDLEAILYILNCFENLIHLNIERNNCFLYYGVNPLIRDEMMIKLVDILSSHEHIKILNLDFNFFTEINQEENFIKIFEKNKKIKSIRMEAREPSFLFDIENLELEEIRVNNIDRVKSDYSGLHHNKTLKRLTIKSIYCY